MRITVLEKEVGRGGVEEEYRIIFSSKEEKFPFFLGSLDGLIIDIRQIR